MDGVVSDVLPAVSCRHATFVCVGSGGQLSFPAANAAHVDFLSRDFNRHAGGEYYSRAILVVFGCSVVLGYHRHDD